MKAISLWQPWATLMAIGAKTIETRGWPTSYRGPLVICATKTWNKDVLRELTFANRNPELLSDWLVMVKVLSNAGYKTLGELPLGAALCVTDLYGCRSVGGLNPPGEELVVGDFSPGRFGWLTRNVRRFAEPIPVKGKQGLWDFPNEMLGELRP